MTQTIFHPRHTKGHGFQSPYMQSPIFSEKGGPLRGNSLRCRRFRNPREWSLDKRLGFLIGQPANQQLMENGFSVQRWFSLVFWERWHFRLRLAKEFSGLLRFILLEEAHGAEKAGGSLKLTLVTCRLFETLDPFTSCPSPIQPAFFAIPRPGQAAE